jgi:PleD family two-component response regulator
MIRQSPDFKTTKVVNDEKKQSQVQEGKGGILVVDGHPAVCRELMQLVNQEADLRVCAEANNAAQALGSVDVRQVDLAIVDISMDHKNGPKNRGSSALRPIPTEQWGLRIHYFDQGGWKGVSIGAG